MERINLLQVGNSAKSKHELYRILTVEGGMYLPPEKECCMTFISEICIGDKRLVLYSSQVSVCIVPQVAGLRNENILNHLLEHCGGQDYVSHNYLERTPNRAWMANLCKGCAVGLIGNTIDTLGFQEFISSVLKQRSSRILEKQGFSMDVDSNVARILTSSKFVAVKGGRSNLLLKRAIMRKAKLEVKAKEEETKEILNSVPDFRQQIEELHEEIMDQERLLEKSKADRDILSRLYDCGYIDAEGNILK